MWLTLVDEYRGGSARLRVWLAIAPAALPPIPIRKPTGAQCVSLVVLIGASAASIAGNALHAIVQADHVAPALAAAVATAPPLVLLGSTEGLSLLIKVHRRPTLTFWAAVIMTLLLGAGAFRLSFDALCSLAIRCGIRPSLAWLWPLIIDVTTAQATVALVALTRLLHSRAEAPPALVEEDVPVSLSATPLPVAGSSAGERDRPWWRSSRTGRCHRFQSGRRCAPRAS